MTFINLRQLRYLVKIVEVGNITRAAEQLFVAQPALGLQIRLLEQDLGVALLVRHSRGVTPTEPGRVLYERACAILRLVEEAKKEISAFGEGDHEAISLGLTPGVLNLMGPDILLNARIRLTQVSLSLVEELSYVLVEALERGEIDLAIAYAVPERSSLLRTPVLEESMMLVTAPGGPADVGVGERETMPFSEVVQLPLVLATEKDSLRNLITSTAESMGLTPNIAFEASSVGTMRNLIASGAAVGIMPYGTAKRDLDRHALAACRIEDPAIRRTLYVVSSTRRARFKNEAEMMTFIAAFLGDLAEKLGPLATRLPALDGPLPLVG